MSHPDHELLRLVIKKVDKKWLLGLRMKFDYFFWLVNDKLTPQN